MIFEKQISTTSYVCSFCQTTYSRKEDAEKCEARCVKLLKSPDITALNLTSRTYNILKIAGIDTVDEVLEMTDSHLLKLKGLGQVCLRELHQRLQTFGGQNKGTDRVQEFLDNPNVKCKVRLQAFSKTKPYSECDEWIKRLPDLTKLLENQITLFVDSQDWVGLYKGYRWHNDTWENGFPDILRLETQMRSSLQNSEIKKKDVLDVAYWGKFFYPSMISAPESIPIAEEVLKDDGRFLLQALITLKQNVDGLGPTYLSKIVRFAFPDRAGALDSRIVRVFGIGDPTVNQYQWINIRTHKFGTVWAINRDRRWPLEYGMWLQILTKMVSLINARGIFCPHPRKFLDAGLRTEGIWISADVEMAIFTYITSVLNRLEAKKQDLF